MNRHLSRVIIMQSLYEWDFRQNANIFDIIKRNTDNYEENPDDEFIKNTIDGVTKNISQIDNEIIKAAPEWPIEQIASIDKTILRIAIFEILKSDDVPPKVAINEAVELGKTFGGQNSSKFINGVLGTVYRSSNKYNPEEEKEEMNKKVRKE